MKAAARERAALDKTCEATVQNLFDDVPASLEEELVEVLTRGNRVRIEKIVSTGQASPPGFWYDQDEAEWVVLLRGTAELAFENETKTLAPGDHLLIHAHQKHRVERTSSREPTVWLAVFFEE